MAELVGGGAVLRACTGVEAVVHLAAVIPPTSEEQPEYAKAVNLGGTANVVAACLTQPLPPRLLFVSTLDVHGNTLHRPPPREVDNPMVATNEYTAHKIQGEALSTTFVRLACPYQAARTRTIGRGDM